MDLYYSVPCFLTDESYQKLKYNHNVSESSKAFKILDKIQKIGKKEVVTSFNESLEKIVLYDNVELCAFENDIEMAKKSFFVILTIHRNTLLGRMLIGTGNIDDISALNFINDITNDNIFVKLDNKYYSFEEWFKMLNINLIGTIATAVFCNEKLTDEYKIKILSADKNTDVSRNVFDENLNNNLSYKKGEEIIASEVAIIQQNDKISDEIENNIEIYGITLFLLELVCLKDASVSKTEYLVKRELEANREIGFTIKELEKMIYDSTIAMGFWDIRIFRYHVTEMLSKRLDKIFVIDELYQSSIDNRQKLQQFIDVKSAIITEKENRAINLLLIFLTLFQVIPIIYSIISYFVYNKIKSTDILPSIYTFFFCLIILLIFNVRIIRNRKKKAL